MSYDRRKLWEAVQVIDTHNAEAAMAVRYAMIYINSLETKITDGEKRYKELQDKIEALSPKIDIIKLAGSK